MKRIYLMQNIDCANCAAKMEEKISRIDGVDNVSINFFTQKMTLEADEALHEEIIAQAKKIIKKIEPDCSILA